MAHLFPKHRGNMRFSNIEILNGILYATENGCQWRGWPATMGNWNIFYQHWYRWNKQGVMQQVFEYLREDGMVQAES